MNDQQRAAMQMALEALHNTSNALLFVSADGYSVSKMAADAYDDAEKAITALREALAQHPTDYDQGFVDGVEEGLAMAQPQDHSEQHLNMVQGEPVAWMRKPFGEDVQYCEKPFTTDWTPLYTTPPSSQRADALVEAAIEATKEKAAKVCEALQEVWLEEPVGKRPGYDCAAAIRRMK